MANIVLRIAYDGTDYMGWQNVGYFPNIEHELESVLTQILQHPIKLQAASRTDRGVHADCQVINFHTEKLVDYERLQHSLNRLLPPAIRVLSCVEAPFPSFHATLDAKGKQYKYFLVYDTILLPFWRFTCWHFPHPLDVEKMRQAAYELIGEHDFASFRNAKKGKKVLSTVRSLYQIEIEELEGKRLCISIKGNNFLYKMMRNLVGTLAYIGARKLQLEDLPHILSSGKRADAGMTAPACGLTLHRVYYENELDFNMP